MTLNLVEKIDDFVKINRVLVSVSDKDGLEAFITALLQINPDIQFFSTGGTYQKILSILGGKADCLTQVSAYTGQPETQGGLVKTLDFKIYLGLLTETYNEAHQADLKRTQAVPIDMVVVNLYPFEQTVAGPETSVEKARTHIDIGGPCMIRAAAKNFIRVASVVTPADYPMIVDDMRKTSGHLSLKQRFSLAQKAFSHTADFDRAIADFLLTKTPADAAGCYQL
ncbi:MAG: hypothetical protein RBT11_16580 [Desulfobacterales bacterium]|jgi:phosphoribosylaminoimidazolecarboxamide formyltransferase/IMP cyclohydrolase|nr:hypothetical protein [Desulfobacterales bacterium]